MITPAHFEDSMKENEREHNVKAAVKDTVTILKQFGYDSGANILLRMMEQKEDDAK